MTGDAFEDDLTRELPSALRTFTDLEPFDPRAAESSMDVADEDILAIESSHPLQRTLELPPISRPLSIPAFARDVAPAAARWSQEMLVIGAAFLVACLCVGTIGVLLGRASSSTAHAATAGARTARVGVVVAAHEQVIEPPATAPMKLEAPPPSPPSPPPAAAHARVSAAPRIEPRRAGFQRPASLMRR
jgi:hypothetical protein